MRVFKEFGFEAAHRLPGLPHDHPCGRLHGHSFRCEIHVSGDVDPARGWVVDFAEIDRAFAPLRDALDHRYLNEVEGLDNPTAENIARWIWQRLAASLPGLDQVVVRETCDAGCVYRGDAGA